MDRFPGAVVEQTCTVLEARGLQIPLIHMHGIDTNPQCISNATIYVYLVKKTISLLLFWHFIPFISRETNEKYAHLHMSRYL